MSEINEVLENLPQKGEPAEPAQEENVPKKKGKVGRPKKKPVIEPPANAEQVDAIDEKTNTIEKEKKTPIAKVRSAVTIKKNANGEKISDASEKIPAKRGRKPKALVQAEIFSETQQNSLTNNNTTPEFTEVKKEQIQPNKISFEQNIAFHEKEESAPQKVKNFEFEDDALPVNILSHSVSTGLPQNIGHDDGYNNNYSNNRQSKYSRQYNKNYSNRRTYSTQETEYSQNSRQHYPNTRNNYKQKFPSHSAPAFDNESVIAAISGKKIEYNENIPSFPETDINIPPVIAPSLRQVRQQYRQTIEAPVTPPLYPSAAPMPYQPVVQEENAYSTSKRRRERRKRNKFAQPDRTSGIPNVSEDTTYPSSLSSSSSSLSEVAYFPTYPDEQVALPSMPNLALPASGLQEEQYDYPDYDLRKAPYPAQSGQLVRGQQYSRGRVQQPVQSYIEEPRDSHTGYEYINDVAPQADFEETSRRGILKMFISVQPEEQIEVVITEDGLVTEYFVEMAHQAKIRGNIYKGVIHNVDPNLQAAFVNFGAEKNGFLQIDEVHPEYYLNPHVSSKNHKFPLINKVLRAGQEVLVQVVKEPNGTKGAFLTTWISLAGRFLVLTPGQEQLGVSRKVVDPEERSRLRTLLDGIDPGEDMGVIIRTAAAGATKAEIQADLHYLKCLWFDIVKRGNVAAPSERIHQEVELTQRVVRDYLSDDIREIWIDDEAMAESIHEMASLLYPRRRNLVKLHQDPRQTLWERFNLQKQLNEVTSREVQLPSGGRVVFDQTEALMAIDINSGKTQNKANFHSMVLQTNIEAAQAIARHLRLRDIGGQIVVDFIELRDRNHTREVEKAFKEAMKPDRARYDFGHISPFGLLEIVRQRIGTSAISISSEPCPHCHGTGVRRNMEWQAQDALKEIARKARQEKTTKYVYHTDTELALYLLNTKRDRIMELEERLGIRIEIGF